MNNLSPSQSVYCFFEKNCSSSAPLLLALSGGPDSLYLFICLLHYREQTGQLFHIAHVDHGWRTNSQEEALELEKLAQHYHVPFHLHRLDLSQITGNLEAACRQKRYQFFAELQQIYHFQAVVTGHHQDDQAETILKRLLEGAHWSKWEGLPQETTLYGLRVLRPLLHLTKKKISEELDQQSHRAFKDPTNDHLKFLRARMRHWIFPQLNEQFGKNITPNLIFLSEEAKELTTYFQKRLNPLLKLACHGPWGVFIDLKEKLPSEEIEINYLIRLFCNSQQFFLSRQQVQLAVQALQQGKANCLFETKQGNLWIDRYRLFYLTKPFVFSSLQIKEGLIHQGNWTIHVERSKYNSSKIKSALSRGWEGELTHFIPLSDLSTFSLGFLDHCPYAADLRKQWSQHKVPAFLYAYFPVIWDENEVKGEFLIGKKAFFLQDNQECLKINLKFSLINCID